MKIFLTRNDYDKETETGGWIYLWTVPSGKKVDLFIDTEGTWETGLGNAHRSVLGTGYQFKVLTGKDAPEPRSVCELASLKLIFKDKNDGKVIEYCSAKIYHGPGHQSSTRCHNTKKHHKIHEAYYGRCRQYARWKGQQSFSTYFDNPPQEEEC